MAMQFSLEKEKTGLLLVDVQEKLFPKVENSYEVLCKMSQVIRGFQILGCPIVVTEQYPEGLGTLILPLKQLLSSNEDKVSPFFSKTTFSCLKDPKISQHVLESDIDCWVLIGIEAHVCILQTAKDLLLAEKNVVVLNDAISARSIFDYSSAIAEMRDYGVRISTVETVLFELLGHSKTPEFKEISQLIRCSQDKSSSCCCQS